MKRIEEVVFSVLDLVPAARGGDASQGFGNTLDLARHAEEWGFRRLWLAEHPQMVGGPSAASSALIGEMAEGTHTMRVGSGGVILPNHAPLLLFEQFGRLAAAHPGRVDLGLTTVAGPDQVATHVLGRGLSEPSESFPEDVVELMHYFEGAEAHQSSRSRPGAGLKVPVWLLGSSVSSAKLAGGLGLPYAFTSHFAPEYLMEALHSYRQNFKPSAWLDRPYVLVTTNVLAANTPSEAQTLFTTLQQQFLDLRRGGPGHLQAPVKSMESLWTAREAAGVATALRYAVVGSRERVQRGLERFIDLTNADEVMITTQVFDHAARLRSFEIVAEMRAEWAASQTAMAAHAAMAA